MGVSPALAEGRGDGVYGRFDSDLSLQVDLGAGFTRASDTSASFVAELRARVVDAAGLVLALVAAPLTFTWRDGYLRLRRDEGGPDA